MPMNLIPIKAIKAKKTISNPNQRLVKKFEIPNIAIVKNGNCWLELANWETTFGTTKISSKLIITREVANKTIGYIVAPRISWLRVALFSR